jgi:hypothetical protein
MAGWLTAVGAWWMRLGSNGEFGGQGGGPALDGTVLLSDSPDATAALSDSMLYGLSISDSPAFTVALADE